jgi:cyclopropane-fatty-acyl-phospholipid synthase
MTRLDRMVVEVGPTSFDKLGDLPASFRIAAMIMARLKYGRLDFTFPDGRTLRFKGSEPGPEGEVIVHDPTFASAVLAKGDIGFAEAFMDGKFSTPDLAEVLRYFTINFDSAGKLAVGGAIAQFFHSIRHFFRGNSKKGSKRNILAHYDLGNDFYAKWLDATMTYSSALYADPAAKPLEDLKAAQLTKYRAIANDLNLKPGMRVLEIGSGWGGFAEVAANEFGAEVVSVTISDAQYAYAKKRIADAGLAGKVDIQLRDYRDITGQFDAIVSIEMFEAVGEKYWPVYFGKLAEVLKPGGKALLQIITIDERFFNDYRNRPDFIQHYIFPGGMLISPERIKAQGEAAGLTYGCPRTFGVSYARTLAEWAKRFELAWDDIRSPTFDERFRRLWLYYLAYCEAGFDTHRIDVGHFELTKAG